MKESYIRRVFAKPKKRKKTNPHSTLTPRKRAIIRAKTAGTCHVCGGRLGKGWQADHVIPRYLGGTHSLDNYLPICRECNRLRWSYPPTMIRLMMRFGIFVKHEIRHRTELGEQLIQIALHHDSQTHKRRNRGSKRLN